MPTLEDVDRFMTNMIELNTATTAKLHSLADLNMQLGQKIDRLGIRLDQQAINIDRLIDHGKQIDARLDRIAEGLDQLAGIASGTERKLDRLIEALTKRNGKEGQ